MRRGTLQKLFRWCSLGLLLWGFLFLGCGGQAELSVPKTPEALTDYFVHSFLMDEAEISGICSNLLEEQPDKYAGFVKINAMTDQSGRIGSALRGEVSYHLSVLFGSLGISPAECNTEQLLSSAYQGRFALAAGAASLDFDALLKARGSCKDALEKKFDQFDKIGTADEAPAAEDRQSRLFQAFIRSSDLTVDRILDDPMRVARLLDLSPAVITAMIHFSGALEGLVDKVAQAIPLFGNFARIGLSHLAAEISAWGLEVVLDRLEQGRVIRRANVARAACRVLARGDNRPNIGETLLKRAVLRFSPHAKQAYPPAVLCSEMKSKGRDLCLEVYAGLELDVPGQPRSDQGYGWLVPELPPENPRDDFISLGQLSATLINATDLCSNSECSRDEINRIASISAFHKRDAKPENAAYFKAELGRIDVVMSSLERRISELGEQMNSGFGSVNHAQQSLRGDIVGLRSEMVKVQEQNLQYQSDALKILSNSEKTCSCVLKMKRTEAERARLANAFERCNLGLDHDCLKGVSVDQKSLNNALVAFGFDVAAGSAFDTCGVEPNAGEGMAVVEQIKKLIREYKPLKVEVRAHSDQLDPTLKCQSSAGVKDNLELSRKRAEAVRARLCDDPYFKAMNKPCEELIAAEGAGDQLPIVQCPTDRNTGSAMECHAKNRRLSFSFLDSQKLMLSGECAR